MPSAGNPSKKARKLSINGKISIDGVRPFQEIPKAEVVQLLESKRKLVKSDGLYQFVLWRQALKGEKERAGGSSTRDSFRRLGQRIGTSVSSIC